MKPLVVGNWKMNPKTAEAAKKLAANVASRGRAVKAALVVCPPHPFLSVVPKRLLLGAQDVFYEEEGAYTGAVSASMLKSAGVRYVIVGHSERRALGDTHEIVREKLRAALEGGLSAILCVGENIRDDDGSYLQELKEQLRSALLGLSRSLVDRLVLAYEPVWAIGTKAKGVLSGEDALHTHLFVRKVLTDLVGDRGRRVPILYGGSVSAENAGELYRAGAWQGFLVGRESLDADRFIAIARAAAEKKKR